ncbi:MAG: hypothetical protein IKU37_04550 [Candidatus Gastranaerophilales bacterium]|nr:hypothetical protein [Candidatus Gastranaerophilales bacterium]
MKKALLICMLLLVHNCFAIDWINVTSQKGETFVLDKDSITEKNNYYFYNIRLYSNNADDIVVTMQSQKKHPFCTRIKYYKLSEYESLNGDYANITNNMTDKLEPVAFTSIAYAAYKKVKNIKLSDVVQITF